MNLCECPPSILTLAPHQGGAFLQALLKSHHVSWGAQHQRWAGGPMGQPGSGTIVWRTQVHGDTRHLRKISLVPYRVWREKRVCLWGE